MPMRTAGRSAELGHGSHHVGGILQILRLSHIQSPQTNRFKVRTSAAHIKPYHDIVSGDRV